MGKDFVLLGFKGSFGKTRYFTNIYLSIQKMQYTMIEMKAQELSKTGDITLAYSGV